MKIDPFELRKFRLLDSMSVADLTAMTQHLRRATFSSGSCICYEDEDGDRCFFLMSGQISMNKNLKDGRLVHLGHLSEGTIFGQSGLLENQKRIAQISAQTNVELLFLERSTFSWALSRKMPWALLLLRVAAMSLVRQLRSATEYFETIACADNAFQQEQIKGERIESSRENPVYVNLSGSFASLPAFSEEGEEEFIHEDIEDIAETKQRSSSSREALFELLEIDDYEKGK